MNYIREYRIRTVDFYMITLFLLLSVISHLIAPKIFEVKNNMPLMASSFTYTLVLCLTDMVRAYSTKLNALKFILIEMCFIILLISISLFLLFPRSPAWADNNADAISSTFMLCYYIFKSNFLGVGISLILDILIFSILYQITFKNFNLYFRFLYSSFISTIVIILIYTVTTDYYFLKALYPNHWQQITFYNVISNAIMVFIYTNITAFFIKYIINYIEGDL